MKVIVLLFALLPLTQMYAQTLTPAAALEFARLLGEREILSEKGVEALTNAIENKQFRRRRMPVFMMESSRAEPVETKELSRSVILLFLSEMFAHEAVHRSGIMEMKKMMASVMGPYQDRMMEPGIMDTINNKLRLAAEQLEAEGEQPPGVQLETAIRERTGWTRNTSYFQSKVISFGSWDQRGPAIRLNGYGYIHDNRSALGITLNETLNDLREIGLLSPSIDFEDTADINFSRDPKESEYLLYASGMTARVEDAAYIREAQLAIVEELYEADLLTSANQMALVASIKTEPFAEATKFIPYLKNTLLVELDEMSDDPAILIPAVFAKADDVFPTFNLTVPEFSMVVREEYGTRREVYTATYEFGGQAVTSNIVYRPLREATVAETEVSPLDFGALPNGFNQRLADQGSDRRLVYVPILRDPEFYVERKFALVLLNDSQVVVFQRLFSSLRIYSGSFEPVYSTAEKDEFYTSLQRIGLLDHLSGVEIDEARNCWRQKLTGSFFEVLNCYPRLLAEVGYGEMYDVDTPYRDLTEAFAAAGQGKFKPTAILDNFSESRRSSKTTYGFTLNGKEYRRELDIMGDWIDVQFVDLINEALADQKVAGKFYRCYGGMYILLTEAQSQVLETLDPEIYQEE